MTRSFLFLGIMIGLGGCAAAGESRLNPLNWFEAAEPETPVTELPLPQEDPRGLVSEIVSLRLEPTPEGLIVKAVGRPSSQGFWRADLVRVANGNPAILSYAFRAFPPDGQQPAGTAASREILAGATISNRDLRGISTVVVVGQNNQLSARPR